MKNILRKELIEKRKNLSVRQKYDLDHKLNRSLEDMIELILPIENPNVLAFYPIKKNNEVGIIPFLEYLIEIKANLFFPKVENQLLLTGKVSNLDELNVTSMGIFEPDIAGLETTDFDLILVPGLGFSKSADRIGYGLGFYDILLKEITGFKLGIAYDFQVYDEIPTDKFDVKMDAIITESGFYRN
jgi:5-formyltetrahydrofolate cyclo-ligase